MKLLATLSITIILSLLTSQAAAAAPPSASTAPMDSLTNLTVRAWIDGRDLFYITPGALHWHHLDFAAPGREGFVNLPTALTMNKGGRSTQVIFWFPDWPCVQYECRGEQVDSSEYLLGLPIQPEYQLSDMKVLQARESVTVYQYPSADNGYTTVIDFNDDSHGGAAWYSVMLTFASAARR